MLNRIAGKYQITAEAAKLFTNTHTSYNYAILDSKGDEVFITPTTSIKRGKEVSFGMEVRLQTWTEMENLVKVS